MKKKEELVPIQNTEVVESYKLAFGRNAYGLYAQRARLVLIEALQEYIQGMKFKNDGCVKYDTANCKNGDFGEKTISFDIRRLCPGGIKNFSEVREQLAEMLTLHFEYENEDEWTGVNFFSKVKAKKGSWTVTFHTTKDIWEVFMDFSKGYRRVELETAMKFKSVYSLKFYEKIVGQKESITYTIDELRAMFRLEKKYKSNRDFVARVIQTAKNELDRISPWTFDYRENFKAAGRGRPSLESVTLFPVHSIKNEGDSGNFIRHNLSLSGLIGKETLDLLKEKFGFKPQEIKNNSRLFEIADKALNLPEFLRQIAPRALRAEKNVQGFVINAIKKELRREIQLNV